MGSEVRILGSEVRILDAVLHQATNEVNSLLEDFDEETRRKISDFLMSAVHEDAIYHLLATRSMTRPDSNLGDTALMIAVKEGNPEIVDIILNSGVDTDIQNKNGDTALIIAAKSGREEIVALLLAYGADTTITDNEGRNAYDLASGSIRNMILEYNMKIERYIENSTGRTKY